MRSKPVIKKENDSMIIEERENSAILFDQIFHQWKSEKFCDIILYVGENALRAHRCVLAAASTYFRSILKDGKIVKEQLKIDCDGSEVLHSVLSFMYSGSIILNEANVCGILKLAVTFHMLNLKDYCSDFLETAVKVNNCLDVFELAKSQNLEKVKESSTQFIASHINEVLDSNQVLKISLIRFESFIRSELWIIPEKEMFPLITSWVHHSTKKREKYYRSLLTWVSLSSFTPYELSEYLTQHPLFEDSKMCKSFLYDALCDYPHLQVLIPEWKRSFQLQQVVSNQEDNDNFLNFAISTAINIFPCNDKSFEKDLCNNIEENQPCENSAFSLAHSIKGSPYVLPDLPRIASTSSSQNHSYLIESHDQYDSGVTEEQSQIECLTSKIMEEVEGTFLQPSNYAKNINSKENNLPEKMLNPSFLCSESQGNGSLMMCNDKTIVASSSNDEVTYSSLDTGTEIALEGDLLLSSKDENGTVDVNDESVSLDHSNETSHNSTTASRYSLRQNLKTLNSPLKKRIVCDTGFSKTCTECKSTFQEKKLFFKHMRSHFPGPPHICSTCQASFKRIYHLVDHLDVHSDESVFKCSVCSFSSKRLFNLNEHIKSRHSDKQKPFTCDECGTGFHRRQHLEKHMTKHSTDRPMVCETCGSRWKTRDSLLLHSKTHSGDLYSCHYSNCAYRTPKVSHLKNHLQYHSNVRPFPCGVCDKVFVSKSHLLRHKLRHENNNSHHCSQCSYSTGRLDVLKQHIKRKHRRVPTNNGLLCSSRKQQFKKKDGFKLMHSDVTLNSTKDPSHENHLSLIDDMVGNGNICLGPFERFDASSPSFEAPGNPDDPLMIVSEIEDNDQLTSSFSQLEPPYKHSFGHLES